MKQDKQEKLLRALNDVGDDLVTGAEDCRYAPNPWKRWGAIAASLALVISLTALALPYFPMGCGAADSAAPEENQTTAPDSDRNETADQNSSIDSSMEDKTTAPEDPSYGFSDDAILDAVASMDMEYLTQAVAAPLIRWQVGSFASAADLSEDGLERLYLAVMERDEPGRDPVASAAQIRKKLSQVLEGTHIYAPLNDDLPLDGALKELPEIYPEHLYVEGQIAVLTVRVDDRSMRITIVLDDGSWRYVSVD